MEVAFFLGEAAFLLGVSDFWEVVFLGAAFFGVTDFWEALLGVTDFWEAAFFRGEDLYRDMRLGLSLYHHLQL